MLAKPSTSCNLYYNYWVATYNHIYSIYNNPQQNDVVSFKAGLLVPHILGSVNPRGRSLGDQANIKYEETFLTFFFKGNLSCDLGSMKLPQALLTQASIAFQSKHTLQLNQT